MSSKKGCVVPCKDRPLYNSTAKRGVKPLPLQIDLPLNNNNNYYSNQLKLHPIVNLISLDDVEIVWRHTNIGIFYQSGPALGGAGPIGINFGRPRFPVNLHQRSVELGAGPNWEQLVQLPNGVFTT